MSDAKHAKNMTTITTAPTTAALARILIKSAKEKTKTNDDALFHKAEKEIDAGILAAASAGNASYQYRVTDMPLERVLRLEHAFTGAPRSFTIERKVVTPELGLPEQYLIITVPEAP